MKRVYVDLEYMYEGMFHERRMPTDRDKKQIIQIAAVLFDHDKGRELKSLDILVKPIFHRKLPEFFIELTNINDEMIEDRAISFSEAISEFLRFCNNYPIWTFNNDYNVFLQNFEFHSIVNQFKCPFSRVKPLLKDFGLDADKYSSGTLYKAVGLNLKGHVHYALHDVRSMSQAMHALEGGVK
jgi:inhibitor of KinA sporulation pathway (predicted exonuclease)